MLDGVLAAREFRAWREDKCEYRHKNRRANTCEDAGLSMDELNTTDILANQPLHAGANLQSKLNAVEPGKGARLLQSCLLGAKEQSYLVEAAGHFRLSGRGIMRALAVSRTIADIEHKERVSSAHLLEAVTFRAEGRGGNG
jgi:hypothetical protein